MEIRSQIAKQYKNIVFIGKFRTGIHYEDLAQYFNDDGGYDCPNEGSSYAVQANTLCHWRYIIPSGYVQ